MFDIIVVGGNLAGATAAINAAKKGVNVALIERNIEPFFPAHCGEAMADIWTELLNINKISCHKNEIKNLIFNVSSSKDYKLELKKHRVIIFDRNYVEKYLLKEAEKKGVSLFLGKSVRDFKPFYEILLDNNEIIKGKVIIDASGISCQIGRRIGLDAKLNKRDIGVCIQSRVQSCFNEDTLKIWFHKPYAPFGYAWLFPVDEKTANIGIGIPGGQKIDLVKMLEKFIGYSIPNDYKTIHTFRACVPITSPMSRLIKDNVLVVGDAARLVNAEWGCGIGNAIFSGRSAGKIAAQYVIGEIKTLEPYQDLMRKRILLLRKAYKNRKKFENEKKYVRTYRRNLSILSIINKIFPDFIQDYFLKVILYRIG
jgi:digeranylgeranylglycerophospholipid reductase